MDMDIIRRYGKERRKPQNAWRKSVRLKWCPTIASLLQIVEKIVTWGQEMVREICGWGKLWPYGSHCTITRTNALPRRKKITLCYQRTYEESADDGCSISLSIRDMYAESSCVVVATCSKRHILIQALGSRAYALCCRKSTHEAVACGENSRILSLG